jgi:hypothetical protein
MAYGPNQGPGAFKCVHISDVLYALFLLRR